ncbi:MAG: hypothetical protein ACFFFG_17780 [Candidatus Thorarchaeota archaeon]
MILETKLLLKVLKGNFRLYSTVIFSLTLIVTSIVSISIILDSNDEELFNVTKNALDESEEYHLRLDILYQQDYLAFEVSTLTQIVNDVQNRLTELGLDNYLSGFWIEPGIGFFNQNASTSEIYGRAYYFEESNGLNIERLLQPGSRLPLNSNETILIVPADVEDNFITNTTYYFSALSPYDSLFSLKVVGILSVLKETQFPSRSAYIDYIANLRIETGLNISPEFYGLISQKSDYAHLLKDIGESSLEHPSELQGRKPVEFYLRFYVHFLKIGDIESYLGSLELLKERINSLNLVRDNLGESFTNFQRIKVVRFLEFVVTALPLILISLYFATFAANNTNYSRLKQYRTLAIRGMSFRQNLVLLFVEAVITLICILLVGLIFGISLSYFLITFFGAASSLVVHIENWFGYSAFTAIACVTFVYGKITRRISTVRQTRGMTTSLLDEPIPIRSWALKLLLIGLGTLVTALWIGNSDLPLWTLAPEAAIFIEILLYASIIIPLILFSIGLIFSMRMGFRYIVELLSQKLWRKHHNNLSLALKNLWRYQRAASDIWLLLTLLITYSFILMSSSASTELYMKEEGKFLAGADWRIGYPQNREAELIDFLSRNLPQNSLYTKITVSHMFYRQEVEEHGIILLDVNLLGIDPDTFFEVAYTHPQVKFSPSIGDFREKLLSRNLSVSASRGFLQREKLALNDNYSLALLARNSTLSNPFYSHHITNVTITSSFEIYPLIASEKRDRALILHQGFLLGLDSISDDPSSMTTKYFLLIRSNAELPAQTIQTLEENYSAEVTSIEEEFNQLKLDGLWDLTQSSHQMIHGISLILTLGGFIIFGIFQQISRTKEHAIERVLGMLKREIYYVTLIERVFIVALALISGGTVGSLFFGISTLAFASIGTFSGIRPGIIFPFADYVMYLLWFILFVMISLLPSIILQQKYDVGLLLKRQN